MKRLTLFFLSLLFCSGNIFSQTYWKFSTEQDVLPYLFGGYYLNLNAGKDHLRGRIIFAKVIKPDFVLPYGFTNNKIYAAAVLIDYFPEENFNKFWYSLGLVNWNGSVQTKKKIETADVNDYLFSIGGGYNYFFNPNLYVSPWGAIHTKISGTKNVKVDDQTFNTPLFNPEGSLKIGWIF